MMQATSNQSDISLNGHDDFCEMKPEEILEKLHSIQIPAEPLTANAVLNQASIASNGTWTVGTDPSQYGSYTSIGTYGGGNATNVTDWFYENSKPKPAIELKLLDGRKCSLRAEDLRNIVGIEERSKLEWTFKKHFPFIAKEEKSRYVHFVCKSFDGSQTSYTEFDVDCTLSAFCKLVDIEFKSFSTTVLEDAITNG